MRKRILSILLVLSIMASFVVALPTSAFAATSGTCGENLTWVLEEGKLTISGTGAMTDYSSSSDIPWYSVRSSIISAEIEYGVTSICNYAFNSCRSLASITLPNSVTSIDRSAFSGCSSLTDITLPDNLTSIGNSAFQQCSSLTSITIPDRVRTIGTHAFDRCSKLTSISIPDSVTTIGFSAFYGCDSLTNITVNENNAYYSSKDGNLFNKNKTVLIQYAIGKTNTNYIIPDSVTSIASNAFRGCSNLTYVVLPDSMISIGSDAFCNCDNLTSITIPDSVTSIGETAFFGCDSLTSITIPDGVTTIGNSTFSSCYSLTNISIPDSITTIGENAFSYCYNLTSISIPDNVITIGKNAFFECNSLTNITINENNAYYSSKDGNLFNKNKTVLIQYAIGKTNTTYIIPDSVTDIASEAFRGCSNLTSITIPDSITKIGASAFEQCNSLTNITIPDSVTTIGSSSFSECDSLTSITIPDSVKNIGASAFRGCNSLTNITISGSVTSIGSSAFIGCYSLTSITIPDSVTSIGMYTFFNCKNLTSITIPDGVTSIGRYAFYQCSSLTDVYYTGTEKEWNDISIGSYNDYLTNATIHYNYIPAPETYYPQKANTGIEVNKHGVAYGRFALKDTNGNPLKSKTLTYSFDGYSGTYTTTTDENGIATVVTPKLTGDSETVQLTCRFVGADLAQSTFNMEVYISDLSFSQSWEGKVSTGVGVEAALGVDGEIVIAEAEAKIASIGAEGKIAKTLSVKNFYKDGVRSLRLASSMASELAAKAKAGLFADASFTGINGAEISAGDVSGNATVGSSQEIALNIEDYNPDNMEQLGKIGYFLIDCATDVNGSNVVTRKLLEYFDLQSYNETGIATSAKLEGGAKLGAIEAGNFEGSLVGIGESAVWTYKAGIDKDNKNTYSSEITTDADFGLGNVEVKFSDTVSSDATAYSKSFINNKLEFSAASSAEELEEFEIKSLEKNENKTIFWNSKNTDYSQTLKYTNDDAVTATSSNENILDFINGNKGWFAVNTMTKATEDVLNSGASAEYSREKSLSNGTDIPLKFGITAGLGLNIGLGLSCIEEVSYDIEDGIRTNGVIYTQSKSDIDSYVENNKTTLTALLAEPIEAISNEISEFFDSISGAISDGIEWGKSKITGAVDWVVSITSFAETPSAMSYSILSINDEAELFSTSSVASTVGEPYIVAVKDSNGNEITDFGTETITLTLSYDDTSLAAAGIANTEEALQNLKIYHWNEEKCVYVCIGGTLDYANSGVNTDITKPGQYILAIDNCAPAITEFKVSDSSATPVITAVVADMSGISDFEFTLDGETVVDNSNFDDFYNYSTALFSYKPQVALTDGVHTAYIAATDSSGNTLEAPVELTFEVNTVPPVLTNVNIPEYSTDNALIITAEAEDADLSALSTYIEYNGSIYSYEMTETDGVWAAEISDLPDFTKVNAYVTAYDSLGNSSTSDKQIISIAKSNGSDFYTGIMEFSNDGVLITVYNSGESTSGKLMIAGYDADGTLQELKYTDYTHNGGYDEKFINITPTHNSYKIFYWNSLEDISPLCKSSISKSE